VLLAALGIVLLSAAATAVLAVNEIGKVVEALGQNRAVKLAPRVLAPAARGEPQTLLLVGDDRRPPPRRNPGGFVLPHSNEMLLVRIDPSKPTIAMLSIPRELQVTIRPPEARPVVNRINAAYTIGGIQLMTETIKQVLGVAVNHVFVVTFPRFKRAVNEMGCVYLTVDRRYYHVNEAGSEQYFEINLQPGYQRVCGREALEFVANRHEDTSLTRDARDQRFLLEAKAQYGASLFESRGKFEHILGRAVETDLHGSGQVLDLLELLVQSQGKPVRQVHFQVNLLPTYDTASPAQIRESVRMFLGGTAPIPARTLRRALHISHAHHQTRPTGVTLARTSDAALVQARTAAPNLPFALEYPRARHIYGAALPDTLRLYDIRDPHGRLHPAYVVVVDGGPLGQFYDVQATSWAEPPLLSNPTQTVREGARTYELFYSGESLRTIAWREGHAVYWIENTLTNSIPAREMLAIAEQTLPVVNTIRGVVLRPPARSIKLPPRTGSGVSVFSKLAGALGLASLAALVALALAVLARHRELAGLRAQVSRAMALEARQRPLLAGAPAGAPAAAAASAADRAPTIYRARRRWRPGAIAVALAAPLAGVAVAVLLMSPGSSSPAREGIPIAVFNATAKRGAAHAVAAKLRTRHLHVSKIGPIKDASLSKGAYVLYPPGAQRQARQVAGLIASLSPTVAAIQPAVQSAVGGRNEIVVVLD
jgi:LCP family protein required for cell wall assembly